MKILILIPLLTISLFSSCQVLKMKESYYQDKFAEIIHGQKEIVLDDKARVDIVTDSFAIEVDFAEKWAESIGQSLYYAEELNKKAGVLLIVNDTLDDRYIKRLMTIAMKYDITVWLINYDTNWCKVIIKPKEYLYEIIK